MRAYGFHEREEENPALGYPLNRITEMGGSIPRGITMGVAV
jgi:hypothetical protein